MQISSSDPRVGDHVRVRGQSWRVQDVRDYGACRLFTLSGTDRSNHDVERRFLAPFDRLARLDDRRRAAFVGPRAWPRVLRGLIAEQGPADGLRTAARAGIDLLPHQLEPALALLRGLGTRVLLADEVGLGKTVQAALAIAELRVRGLADRVLVVTPAGLRDQWCDELSRRFSIAAGVADAREIRRRAALAPLGTNPWTTLDVAVASMDFVKRPEVLPSLRDAGWDVIVVDEAHGSAAQSDRHDAISRLCRETPYVLLLTATPHSGDRARFESLCGIGSIGRDPLLVFRRKRGDISLEARRRAHLLPVRQSAAERLMHHRLQAFVRAVHSEWSDSSPLRLALSVLHKRAFSSPWSLAESVRRRLAGLMPQEPSAGQMELPLRHDAGELDADDDTPAWTVPGLGDPRRERLLLERLEAAARQAVRDETKLAALGRLVRRLLRRREKIIVFTEYRDTLLHLRRSLAVHAAIVHGGLVREERQAALSAFTSGAAEVLLATDAAGEGLNLHAGCRVVVNLELPWNPNRLEQRAGRVDRIGQKRPVHVFHLVAAGTGEEDLLSRLEGRIALARHDIDVASPLADAPFPHDSPTPPDRVPTHVDASAEHARLTSCRAVLSVRDPHPTTRLAGPAAARAGRALRRRLEGRALAIVCSALEDRCGRRVATRVSGALVDGPFARLGAGRGRQLETLLAEIERRVLMVDHRAGREWTAHNEAAHAALLRRRLARETSIRSASASDAGELQLGLFDRRTERALRLVEDRQLRSAAQDRERVARIERALELAPSLSRVVLVLLP